MSKRKDSPDLMSDFLSGASSPTPPQKPEEEESEDATSKRGRPPSDVPKSAATYYLPDDLLDKLEEVWYELRGDLGRGFSKSHIVESALEIALDDIKRRGVNSRYIKRIK